MKLFLAESNGARLSYINKVHSQLMKRGGVPNYKPYILESFFYTNEKTEKCLHLHGDYLLDSGAFTFMSKGGVIDCEEYIERYCDYINRNNIEKFFELDIDSIVGYDRVLKYRDKIESLTGKKCIPVFHRERGKNEFLRMCRDYPYVAIGGLAIKDISRKEYKFLKWFIDTSHENGAKIHGLGFTNLEWLKKLRFDSVDSTSWVAGNRFGFLWKFDGKEMKKIEIKDRRLSNADKVAQHNYIEWCKFQMYAYKHY